MTKSARRSPAELTANWPHSPSEDFAGEAARLFVLNVLSAMGDVSVRSLARAADLDEGTILHLLSGDGWPDLRTIAQLERALRAPLYPRTAL